MQLCLFLFCESILFLTQHLAIYYFVIDHTHIQWHKTTIHYSLPFCGMAEAQLDGSAVRTLERMGLEPSQLHASSHVASSLCLRSWTCLIMASFQERAIQADKITSCDLLKHSVTSATFQWSEQLQSQPRLSRRGDRWITGVPGKVGPFLLHHKSGLFTEREEKAIFFKKNSIFTAVCQTLGIEEIHCMWEMWCVTQGLE